MCHPPVHGVQVAPGHGPVEGGVGVPGALGVPAVRLEALQQGVDAALPGAAPRPAQQRGGEARHGAAPVSAALGLNLRHRAVLLNKYGTLTH